MVAIRVDLGDVLVKLREHVANGVPLDLMRNEAETILLHIEASMRLSPERSNEIRYAYLVPPHSKMRVLVTQSDPDSRSSWSVSVEDLRRTGVKWEPRTDIPNTGHSSEVEAFKHATRLWSALQREGTTTSSALNEG